MRIGIGYDLHRLVPGRPLILGGVTLSHDKGLDGHSDADVLTHAIIDALLGALALGDIGAHFPDTDPRYKDADSLKLLQYVHALIQSHGHQIINIDTIVVAERPKLRSHIDTIRTRIAEALNIEAQAISIKAKTNEKSGPEGREEAISAHAVVLLG